MAGNGLDVEATDWPKERSGPWDQMVTGQESQQLKPNGNGACPRHVRRPPDRYPVLMSSTRTPHSPRLLAINLIPPSTQEEMKGGIRD